MAYKNHALVAFGGTLNYGGVTGKVEQWQCTLRVSESPVVSDVELSAVSNPLTDPVAFMEWAAPNLLTQFRSATHGALTNTGAMSMASLEWLKVNNVGVKSNGKFGYTDAVPHIHQYAASQFGGVTVAGQSWLTTCCGSLRSNTRTRGLATKGRMYLPAYVPASNSPWIATSQRDALAAFYADIIRCFKCDGNGTYPHPVVPAIHSPGNVANGHHGQFTPIDYVMVGDILDTVRRRKNKLIELYSPHVAV